MARAPDSSLSDEVGDLDGGSLRDAFRIQLPNFEGPLDLLLHLIREHKLDIFDIPIALITEKYLHHLELMRKLNLDVAGEFILMAATLAHLKSRMLLPRVESQAVDEDEPGPDPREELVRRLLEYQKYREAAGQLGEQPILDRDVFPRRAPPPETPVGEGEVGLVELSVFKLIEAFDRVMKAAHIEIPHEVLVERTSITDAIGMLADKLREQAELSFFELFAGHRDRGYLVALFLALLEMTRLRLIKLYQEAVGGDIVVRTASGQVLESAPEVDDEFR